MANMDTINLPLGDLVKPEEWGTKAFVYGPSSDEFYITQEKHKALEFASARKFEATVSVKDGQVIIALPADFARVYLWNRKAQIVKIVHAEGQAICVFAKSVEKKKK
jgi:hypothetical protein